VPDTVEWASTESIRAAEVMLEDSTTIESISTDTIRITSASKECVISTCERIPHSALQSTWKSCGPSFQNRHAPNIKRTQRLFP